MGNLLQLQNASKSFGTKELFHGATFAVNDGEHVGVIGPNGAGKTTLFKILVGLEELDSGEYIKSKNLKIGYLQQESDWDLSKTAEEFISRNNLRPLWELKNLGFQLGLSEKQFQEPMQNLSGGFRMRVQLLYLIGQEPDLLLLDEPTNFLDLESVLALEQFLVNFSGAFLMISHDREFLKRTTVSTLEVEGGDVQKFPGNIEDYFEQKAQLREIIEAQAANLEAKRKHIQNFIDRFGAKATKAKQAQSRMKQLEKMETIEVKELPVRAAIQLPPPTHTGKQILEIKNAQLGYDQNIILKDVSLNLLRGDHVGIVGPNGAGKSTLLKSLSGQIPLITGEIQYGYQVSLSIFNQHSAEQLVATDTVLEALGRAQHFETTKEELLSVAGALLFSGDALQKKISVLSGGEKARVALGQMLLRKSPLLLLDEPTNHLDFDTVNALTKALNQFDGTLVVVSHDRSFIGSIAQKLFEINHHQVHVYPGTYDEYVWSLEKGALSQRQSIDQSQSKKGANAVIDTPVGTEEKSSNWVHPRVLRSQLKEIEKNILKIEMKLSQMTSDQESLTKEILLVKGDRAVEISKELSALSGRIHQVEDELLVEMEKAEEFRKKIPGSLE